ncbi:hypothetical protein [Streptosporangium sp. CA-115845]|uniref:hypothetical protein n=1 Tax=Streptosporangium sp. CA-115845 TaxID=3240071 RepID=UPI003D8F9E2B
MSGAVLTSARQQGCLITVCRGCCCGTLRKHPDVDHQEHLNLLRGRLPRPFRVRVVTDCLGPCLQSNVIVVTPSPKGRRAGGRPVWLGLVLDTEVIEDIVAWVDAGGPGIADLPAVLGLHTFKRLRRGHRSSTAPAEPE